MTPEDLEEFRKSIVKMRSSESHMAHLAADILDAAVEHIDAQADQIATLKAALVDRQSRLLGECDGDCKLADCNKCELSEAILQLAREMPEIFGDDTDE